MRLMWPATVSDVDSQLELWYSTWDILMVRHCELCPGGLELIGYEVIPSTALDSELATSLPVP
jgi:hypothetical protein